MKRIAILVVMLLAGPTMSFAQWNTIGSLLIPNVFTGGNVGIGTAVPGAKLSFPNVDASTSADGITWYNPSPKEYGIFKSAGAWTAPNYQQLNLQWETGPWMVKHFGNELL